MKDAIKIFDDKKIRSVWDDAADKWWFSVVDIVGVLIDNGRPRKYWNDLKTKLSEEGFFQLSEKIGQLKMLSSDGKSYLTDVADATQIFRIIQSIPSKKAEPFKQWLAKVGSERLDEMADPEIGIQRALGHYSRLGYDESWVMQRLKSIEIRKELTNEWEKSGVKKGLEFALLTDEITRAWSDMDTREYKKLKDIQKQSLRDNMTNAELVLNMLAELSTTEIAQKEKPHSFNENIKVAARGGAVAKQARKRLEKETGKSVIVGKNMKKISVKK